VDSAANTVEWIVSVSMLSEGWDVKNVFQIVPHEERAFNSKLLIAQVLGRGLRRPEDWKGEDPMVTVFNHDAWSMRIRDLVNEILEIERRLTSCIVSSSPYHFDLQNLDYTRDEETSEHEKKGEYRLLEDGYIDLPSQVEAEDVTVEFERAVSGDHAKFKTQIAHKTCSVEEVAEVMFNRLKSIDEETKDAEKPGDRTNYAKRFPLERCERIVQESLTRAKTKSGRVTEDNRQRVLQALGTLRRKKAKRVVYKQRPKALVTLSTRDRQADSCSAAELRRAAKTIFYGPGCEATLMDEQVDFFKEVQDGDGDFRSGREALLNSHDFKTPLNLVIADATPERKFVRQLCERENAQAIDAWIKNTSQRFYSIEYAWKKGEHAKRGEFSPDFFIKAGDWILVVEIKDDSEISEPSPENQKKYEYAKAHFDRLNQWLQREDVSVRYQFNFLTPKNYGIFFQKLREKDLEGFRSEIDIALSKGDAS
jgi:type III restriction enzyme